MAASYPLWEKPKVFHYDGKWWYCSFGAETIPALIELVDTYFVEIPRNPIFRDGGA